MRYLALDLGEKRIGIAVSDDGHARRLQTLENKADSADEIKKIAGEHQVDTVIIGRARTIEGELGFQAERQKEFAERLEKLGVKIDWEDESGTSWLAHERLRHEGVKEEDMKQQLDMVAAEIILEGYLKEHKE